MGLLDFFGSDNNETPSNYVMASPVLDYTSAQAPGSGVLAAGGPSYFELDMFGTPSTQPDGVTLLDSRSNTSFFTFDQSKVSASIFDVMKSGAEAALRVGVQTASDSINRNAKNPGIVGSFLNNFRSTKTGAQINAAAYATSAQAWLMNPVVWVVAIVGIAAVFLLRK
jgi:hypothetical protein